MSKSIGKILGAGNASTGMFGSEKSILNYLNNYDTTNVDNTYKNMVQNAYNLSNTLSSRPDYVYSETQRSQLETRLQNQGLSVGSEAYQRAMNDLTQKQNESYTQAAYNSIIQGQDAFTNSLNNQINAGTFQNNARNQAVNEILNLLTNSHSGYDVNMDKYRVQSGADTRIAANKAANADAQQAVGMNFLQGAASAALGLFSDEELKEGIIPVGKLFNGLTVYLYAYRGDPTPQIGLMAQEVAFENPDAVFVDESGYLKINYALACR